MQAISQKVGSSVDLFVPNVENIDHAFEGSDLDQGLAGRLATEMDREKILYQQPIGGGKYQFAARMSVTDDSEIEKLKDQIQMPFRRLDTFRSTSMSWELICCHPQLINLMGLKALASCMFVKAHISVRMPMVAHRSEECVPVRKMLRASSEWQQR
jgi:hypothetical protein